MAAAGWGLLGLARDRPTPRDLGATAAAAVPPPPGAGEASPLAGGAQPPSPATSTSPPLTVAGGLPTDLTIPTIGLHAAVRPVHDDHGSLAVPEDPSQVGWWDAGTLPGAPTGTVVLDGHVDTTAGPGALYRLTQLKPSDTVILTTTGPQRFTYTVIGRRVIRKASGLPADLFTTTGPPRLVLITCGGPFNHTTRTYQDNIVVFATPT